MVSHLWEKLVENYYLGENKSLDVVSSHWRQEDEHFLIEHQDDGSRKFSCQGMGPVRWKSEKQKKLDLWCQKIHTLYASRAREALELIQEYGPELEQAGVDSTMDVFRHACTASLLRSHQPDGGYGRILLIGDGYGVLGALLKKMGLAKKLVYVDLGKSLAIQSHLGSLLFPEIEQKLIDRAAFDDDAEILFCPAEDCDRLNHFQFDLAINVASMQEMTEEVVANYFKILRNTLVGPQHFYCCNRIHKELPDGEISEILNYPWHREDHYLIDESCLWHQYFFATWKTRKGIGVGKLRLPYVNLYDGPHHHRLVQMKGVSV